MISTLLFNFILSVNFVPFVSNNIQFHTLKGNAMYIEEKILNTTFTLSSPISTNNVFLMLVYPLIQG